MTLLETGLVRPFEVTHRGVLAIAIPMTLAYLTTPLVGVVNLGVIGQLADPALVGGVSIGALVFDFVFVTFNFLRSGTTASELTKGFRYGVWLYSSPTHQLSLGLVPQAVTSTGANKGVIGVGADPAAIAASKESGAAQLASALRATLKEIFTYKEILITKETNQAEDGTFIPGSKHGPIVVSGPFVKASS